MQNQTKRKPFFATCNGCGKNSLRRTPGCKTCRQRHDYWKKCAPELYKSAPTKCAGCGIDYSIQEPKPDCRNCIARERHRRNALYIKKPRKPRIKVEGKCRSCGTAWSKRTVGCETCQRRHTSYRRKGKPYDRGIDLTCAGCGRLIDNTLKFTTGCNTCSIRLKNRERRECTVLEPREPIKRELKELKYKPKSKKKTPKAKPKKQPKVKPVPIVQVKKPVNDFTGADPGHAVPNKGGKQQDWAALDQYILARRQRKQHHENLERRRQPNGQHTHHVSQTRRRNPAASIPS